MIRVGQRLKEARIAKGLTLEDVAQATKIRPAFLSAIERGEYHKLPSPSYAHGFVSNYAEYLGLPKREMMAIFRREFDEEKQFKVLPEGFVKDDSLPVRRIKIRRTLLGVVGILILVVAFLLYQYRFAFLNPPLTVSTPKEGTTVEQQITVKGKTDPSVSLSVNNDPVSLDDNGNFMKNITAFPGKTTILVKAVNQFGRQTVVNRTVIVSSNP
jgi:cytoskeletal protein RodZ